MEEVGRHCLMHLETRQGLKSAKMQHGYHVGSELSDSR